jgi:hypothetical protein
MPAKLREDSSFRPEPTGPAFGRPEDRLRAEPEIQGHRKDPLLWMPAFAGMTAEVRIDPR